MHLESLFIHLLKQMPATQFSLQKITVPKKLSNIKKANFPNKNRWRWKSFKSSFISMTIKFVFEPSHNLPGWTKLVHYIVGQWERAGIHHGGLMRHPAVTHNTLLWGLIKTGEITSIEKYWWFGNALKSILCSGEVVLSRDCLPVINGVG